MKHKHKWKKTGKAYYTCPLSFEYKCSCGKTKWVEDPNTGIKHIKLTLEQMKERYPKLNWSKYEEPPFIKEKKKKVLLASADVYRPAAIELLKTLANSLEIDCFDSNASQKPQDIAKDALAHAKKFYYDVLIFDTAGRLGIDQQMMDEIKQLHQLLQPTETLFVVDAMLGQDAVNTARSFGDALPLTGIILTKLDGDARGGAALSVRQITGKPIKYIGVSEKVDGLEPFHPERSVS